MFKNLKKFGQILKALRLKKQLTLREACRLVNYDASNWSKIERGKISPPSDERILRRWARVLGIISKRQLQEFIDQAKIAQGIIPQDILSEEELVAMLPTVFRTLRGDKPSKQELDKLIALIRNA